MNVAKALLKQAVVISNLVKEAKLAVGKQFHIKAMYLEENGWLLVEPDPVDANWPTVLIPSSNILSVTPEPVKEPAALETEPQPTMLPELPVSPEAEALMPPDPDAGEQPDPEAATPAEPAKKRSWRGKKEKK